MILKQLKKLLFDESCIICHSRNKGRFVNLCSACENMLQRIPLAICPICGHPLMNNVINCPSCSKLGKIYYDSYSFITFYNDFSQKILMKIKKEGFFVLYRLLVQIILEKSFIINDGIITTVPDNLLTSLKKGRASLAYTLKLFKKKGYPVVKNLYKRSSLLLKSQKTKKVANRIEDIQKSFFINPQKINHYHGKVYLIDDIYTSGATINYGAFLLKQLGFTEVHAVTFFRAFLKDL